MDYNFAQTIHLLAAVAAAGPLLFAPYLSLRLKSCKEEEKILILRSLTIIDRYYSRLGAGSEWNLYAVVKRMVSDIPTMVYPKCLGIHCRFYCRKTPKEPIQ